MALRSSEQAPAVERRLETLLLDERGSSLREGWGFAADVGPAVVPLLGARLRRANRTRDRMLLLGAMVQAGGTAVDPQVFGFLARCGRSDSQEKTFALLALALGPRRPGPAPLLARVIADSDEPIVYIAAALAAERFAEPAAALAEMKRSRLEDPGVLAAVLFAGREPPTTVRAWQRAWDGERRQYEDLVWRGYLLAPDPADAGAEERLRRAQVVYAHDDMRRVAALWLGRAPQRQGVVHFLKTTTREEASVAMMALDPRARADLQQLPDAWLRPVPEILFERRARSLVLYVLDRPLDVLGDQVEAWAGENEAEADSACLALGWRLLRDGRGGGELAARPSEALRPYAGSAWVRWAAGDGNEALEDAAVTLGDPGLVAARRLGLEGRLTVEAAARLLEEALWRRGAHPMLGLLEERRQLVGDLLLHGSRAVPDPSSYLAKGIPPTDPDFFPVAWEYFKLERVPGLRVPAEYRLERIMGRE